jgi:predicted nucleic acid-binding protein
VFVVDTNIIAPLYIRGTYSEAVHELRRCDSFWRTDPFAMIEFSNVLATYRRARYLTTAEAEQCLLEADRFLRPHYIEVRHHAALELAIRHNITAYDARFLALASKLGARLVTEDSKLRAAAPALTQSLAEALAAA